MELAVMILNQLEARGSVFVHGRWFLGAGYIVDF